MEDLTILDVEVEVILRHLGVIALHLEDTVQTVDNSTQVVSEVTVLEEH